MASHTARTRDLTGRTPRRPNNPMIPTLPAAEPLERRRLLASITVTTNGDDRTPGDGSVSLREAVAAANAGSDFNDPDIIANKTGAFGGTNTVVFAPTLTAAGDAVITLTQFDTGLDDGEFGPTAFIITGNVAIQGRTGDQGITVRRDPNSSDFFRLFHVRPGASLTLDDLTLSGGLARGGFGFGGAAGLGGAVFNQGTLTINRCTLSNNTASGGTDDVYGVPGDGAGGGGVGAGTLNAIGGGPNGGLAYSDGGFGGGGGSEGNGGFGGGGGLFGRGGFGGGGGGDGTVGFVDNGGFGGGGAYFNGRDIAAGGGGAGMGGAVFNESGTVSITNSTLALNTAHGGNTFASSAVGAAGGSAFGAAIFTRNGSLTLLNDTIARNTDIRGISGSANGSSPSVSAVGTLYAYSDGTTNGTANRATVVWNNTAICYTRDGTGAASNAVWDYAGNGGNGSSPISYTGSHNLAQAGQGPSAGVITRVPDPQLGALADNGGPTYTLLPVAGSPAIDGGSNGAAATLVSDQRGPGFARVINGTVDVGAVEVQPAGTPPAVVSVKAVDAAGNGAAAGAAVGQRSLVTQLLVTFNEPVTLSGGAFGLGLVNNYGSGKNDGSSDSDASAALGAPTDPSNDGVTWVVPVVSAAGYSYALGSSGGACLDDGVYRLSVHASAVTAAGGTPMNAGYASPLFHRLYGDTDGNKTANALDYQKFKAAFGTGTGQSAYNADLDFDNNGTVNALDYAQFKKRFGTGFTY